MDYTELLKNESFSKFMLSEERIKKIKGFVKKNPELWMQIIEELKKYGGNDKEVVEDVLFIISTKMENEEKIRHIREILEIEKKLSQRGTRVIQWERS